MICRPHTFHDSLGKLCVRPPVYDMDHHITYTHQREKKRNKYGNTWVYTVKLLSSSALSPSQPLESHPLSLVTTRLGLESVLCRKYGRKKTISSCSLSDIPGCRLTPLGEVDVLLVLLLGDKVGLVLGQSSSDSPGLLVSEVEGKVCRGIIDSLTVNNCDASRIQREGTRCCTHTWRSCSCTTP
jgi:hypothetical protein